MENGKKKHIIKQIGNMKENVKKKDITVVLNGKT